MKYIRPIPIDVVMNLVNKKDVVRGWNWEKLEEVMDRHIQMTKIRSCEIPSHT